MLRRRNYFIKKKFQMNFLSGFVLLLILESLLIAGLLINASHDTLTTGYLDSILRVETTHDFFLKSFTLIVSIVIVGSGLTGMAVFILLSHRIAGPLYRFEKTLSQIKDGDLTTRINLRKSDELTELKESLNALIGSLDKDMGRIKKGLEDLDGLLSRKDDPQIVLKITKVIESLKHEIGRFKVTPLKD